MPICSTGFEPGNLTVVETQQSVSDYDKEPDFDPPTMRKR